MFYLIPSPSFLYPFHVLFWNEHTGDDMKKSGDMDGVHGVGPCGDLLLAGF